MNPNILFITFDSFRADKFFGQEKTSQTPNIKKLIESGVYFKQAITSADSTILALNTIFNATFPSGGGNRTWKIKLRDENYLHFLKKCGYNMYGLIPDLTTFSQLTSIFENDDSTFHALPPYAINPLISNTEKIKENISSMKMKEPWFYYIHSLDLHWPLVLPDEYNKEEFGQTQYDRMVSAVDPQLGKILEVVDKKNTLIIITADHGQHIPFDEKGFQNFEPEFKTELNVGKKIMPKSTHKFGAKLIVGLRNKIRDKRLEKANKGLTPYQKRSRLPHTTLSIFDETVRIPLLFTGLDISPKIIDKQVRSVDIFPTIVDLVGLSRRHDRFDGISLLPVFRNGEIKEKPVYMHTTPHVKLTSDDKVGIRTSKYKYFRGNDRNENLNLYDLINDPQENNNIADDNFEIVEKMESILQEIESHSIFDDEDDEISREETKTLENELKKLGYIEEDEKLSYEEVNSGK